jgi:SET domain-containing protein
MTQALALGLGSMFNHSTRDQNVGWTRNTETDVIVYTALRDIKAGQELCISYGSARLWFEDTDAAGDSEDRMGDDDNDTHGETLGELELSGLGRMDL